LDIFDMKLKEFTRRFYRWEYFWLFLIVLAALAAHFSVIAYPAVPIGDENYYIQDANSIVNNHETLRVEHPPLAKLLILAGIKLFGDNPWGWRTLPVLFGAITVILFYLLCRKLKMSRTAASIAAFLLAFENLSFLMSSVAMLDVYMVTFMMAAFLLYVCRRYAASGTAIALSALAKLNGALAGPAVLIHWFFTREKRSRRVLLVIFLAIIAFFVVLIPCNYIITHDFAGSLNPFPSFGTMLSLSQGMTFNNIEQPFKSPPWEWIYSYQAMPFSYAPRYTAAISFDIWVLMIPALLYLLYCAVKKNDAALFGAGWFIALYILWIPAVLFSHRVTYVFYFYPAVGAVCLGLALGLEELLGIFRNRASGKLKWASLSAVIFILAAHTVSFLLLSPLLRTDFTKVLGLTGLQP
jgi:dolichyl-phosphate-mannose-protein mannosyltransferase